MDQPSVSQPPSKRATISDVARLAGVSIATVSRVVNGTAPVADETDQQVRNAIELLNYQPSLAARSLAGHRTHTIGLLLPEISGAFFMPLVRGVERSARQAGYDLLVHLAAISQHSRTDTVGNGTETDDTGDSNATVSAIGEHNTDGLVIFTDRVSDEKISKLWRNGTPLVLLFRSPPDGLPIPTIFFENLQAAQQLVEHLIVEHNRRKIVYLAGPSENEDSQQREEGYRAALNAHGIDFDPGLVATSNFDSGMAQSVVSALLLDGVEFDAIFAADDEAAAGAMMALRHAGKDIPSDVSVVGFDDIQFSEYLTPSLTTVRAPIEEAGIHAAEWLIKLIRSHRVPEQLILPSTVVIRQSCGCR